MGAGLSSSATRSGDSLTAIVPLVDATMTRRTPASAPAASTFFVPSTCTR
jgi:hypothetical protein